MDVGNPSNFVRILEIFSNEMKGLKEQLTCYNVSDNETLECIKNIYHQYNYILDPHGAVGYISLLRYLDEHPEDAGIILETAHPIKFPDALERLSIKVELPSQVNELMKKEKKSTLIPSNYDSLKEYLMNR